MSLAGITAGYHRLWAHRSYNASKPLQYFLAMAGTEEGVITADLDMAELERIRAELPSLANRRPEVYRERAHA